LKRKDKLKKLSDVLGYQFHDLTLLEQALTHKSISSKHNERFEFLGDAVINFIIAEVMYHERMLAREGELSRLRASLVKGETLAAIARELMIGEYLILGSGEMKSGGHQRQSILADSLEAIIAAIYLDSDMVRCKEVVLSWFESRLCNLGEYKQKDPKSKLQEYLQSKKMALPTYQVASVAGEPHDQIFTVACYASKLDLTTTGQASSRRKAEQIAAESMLALIKQKKVKSHD